MVDGAGLPIAGYDAPLALDQAVNDSLLLVNLGRTLPPQPVGLRLTPRQDRRLMVNDFRRFEKMLESLQLQLAPAEPCAAAKLRCAGARVM